MTLKQSRNITLYFVTLNFQIYKLAVGLYLFISIFDGRAYILGGGGAYVRITFDVSNDIFIVPVNYTINEKKYKYTVYHIYNSIIIKQVG